MSEIFVKLPIQKTNAFIAASWAAFALGVSSYLVGLWSAEMPSSEKWFYAVVLVLGFCSFACLIKAVRDTSNGVPVAGDYVGLGWAAFMLSSLLLWIRLLLPEC